MNLDFIGFEDSEIPVSPKQYEINSIEKNMAGAMYEKYHYLGDKGFLHQYSFCLLYTSDAADED